jgi:micrococcal nuclease
MYEYYTKVEKVIDGDTIDVFIDLGFKVWHKNRLRLFGIDTPEKNTPLGAELRKFMIHHLEGKTVKLKVTKPDKYGRYLAVVWLNSSESINDQLIALGLAKSYFGLSKANVWTQEELDKTTIDGELK